MQVKSNSGGSFLSPSSLATAGAVLVLLATQCLNTSVAQLASGGSRPFVTGIRTVVGPNGEIGGISVDAEGVVTRAIIDTGSTMKRIGFRHQNVSPNADVSRASTLRKISLRRLEREIATYCNKAEAFPEDLEFLAGLQSLQYVLVYPDQKDIVIAGPADGWRTGPEGAVVGNASGKPVMHLTDLLVALRMSRESLVQGITCSMDATPEGLQNYARFLRRRLKLDEFGIAKAKEAIGYFEISLSGIPQDSHFAQVIVAADVMLKRLGMQLESTPVKKVPSYIQLLKAAKNSEANNSMPRWWLEMDYQPIVRDTNGLVWRIQGGVKAMTEAGVMASDGAKIILDEENPTAEKWARNFTDGYDELAVKLPVFADLRNAMDLAVLGALITRYRLYEKSSFNAALLRDDTKLQSAKFNVPRKTQPQMTFLRKNRGWIVTVSGGVDVDCWSVVADPKTDDAISDVRDQAEKGIDDRWWWD